MLGVDEGHTQKRGDKTSSVASKSCLRLRVRHPQSSHLVAQRRGGSTRYEVVPQMKRGAGAVEGTPITPFRTPEARQQECAWETNQSTHARRNYQHVDKFQTSRHHYIAEKARRAFTISTAGMCVRVFGP